MKKEWTFNYFVKAEPDKNKAHVPEKHCGLNLWNSFIGNSMLIKKIGLTKEAHFSLGATFYMFGLLRVTKSSISYVLAYKSNIWEKDSIQTIHFWKNEYDFFELLDQLPTSTTYRKSVRHCGKAAHLLANDI